MHIRAGKVCKEYWNNFFWVDWWGTGEKIYLLFQLWRVQSRERSSPLLCLPTLSGGCKVLIEHSNASTSSFFRRWKNLFKSTCKRSSSGNHGRKFGVLKLIYSVISGAPHLFAGAAGTISNYAPLGPSPICIDFPKAAHKSLHTRTRLFDKPLSIWTHSL
jgi:hypothetical protein